MTAASSGALAPRVAIVSEGDPLPPEDRCADRRSLLDRLYRAHASRLHRYFARRASPDDAPDLVNESFLRFAGARTAVEGEVECDEAFLQQIANNVLRNRARAAFHRTTAGLKPDDELPHPTGDLTALIETRDELARLQRALAKLRPKTREIFMSHRLEGATYAEIATRTGMSVKGVEWHMSKAIMLLHRARDRA